MASQFGEIWSEVEDDLNRQLKTLDIQGSGENIFEKREQRPKRKKPNEKQMGLDSLIKTLDIQESGKNIFEKREEKPKREKPNKKQMGLDSLIENQELRKSSLDKLLKLSKQVSQVQTKEDMKKFSHVKVKKDIDNLIENEESSEENWLENLIENQEIGQSSGNPLENLMEKQEMSQSSRSHLDNLIESQAVFKSSDPFRSLSKQMSEGHSIKEEISDKTMESLFSLKIDAEEKDTGMKAFSQLQSHTLETYDLWDSPPLGIFTPASLTAQPEPELIFHDKLEQERKEKELANVLPLNGFQQMMIQTMEGKLWKCPIDNEQGWESEQNVPFHEHVFLDEAIADFPQTGPIRVFMELVINGLSQNPHLSVEEKHQHIDWYRQYFKQPEKQVALKEAVGEEGKFIEL